MQGRYLEKTPTASMLLVLFTSREDKSWLWSLNTRISPAGRPLVIKGILLPLLEGQQQAQPSQPSPSTWGTGRIWEMGIFGSPCKRSRRDGQGRCPLLPPAHPKNCSLSHMETQTITGRSPRSSPGSRFPRNVDFKEELGEGSSSADCFPASISKHPTTGARGKEREFHALPQPQ